MISDRDRINAGATLPAEVLMSGLVMIPGGRKGRSPAILSARKLDGYQTSA